MAPEISTVGTIPICSAPIQVAVDATCWHNNRGYGRHARALLRALIEVDTQREYTLFMDVEPNGHAPPPGATVRIVKSSQPAVVAARANGSRSVRDMWRMGRAMADSKFDILLFPSVYTYVPVLSRSRKVVMIHDVIAETFPQLTVPRRLARLFWNTKVWLGRMQAEAVVTVSENSREGILQRFRLDPERVFVVGEASDPVFRVLEDPQPTPRLQDLGIAPGNRYIVFVGGFSPHKNLETLIGAFAGIKARDDFCDVRLILVGEYKSEVFHSYYDTVRHLVDTHGLADDVIFTGYLDDEELVAVMNLSAVLALPSLMEGFGLPAVEAAACGLPVIATTASPLPALLGEGGIFLDPLEGDLWRQALAKTLASPEDRRRMRSAGLQAAARLTWQQAARQMIEVFQQVEGHACVA